MKVYFLLEDHKSFYIVLPYWLQYTVPGLHSSSGLMDMDKQSYLIESGFGYPQMLLRMEETVKTIQENDIELDYFVVCYDTDEDTFDEMQKREEGFRAVFAKYDISYQPVIIPMTRCFETWLLGNRREYPKYISDGFLSFNSFFDVSKHNPERMSAPKDYTGSKSMYHYRYLQAMLKSSPMGKHNYSKGSPRYAAEARYYDELASRVKETADLESFKRFNDFLVNLKEKI